MKTSKLEIFYDGKLILSLSPNNETFNEELTVKIFAHAQDIYYFLQKLMAESALIVKQILTDGEVQEDDLMRLGTVMRTVNDSCELIDPVGDEDE